MSIDRCAAYLTSHESGVDVDDTVAESQRSMVVFFSCLDYVKLTFFTTFSSSTHSHPNRLDAFEVA